MFSVIVCCRVACLYALGRERAEQGGPGRAGRPRDGSIATTKTRSWRVRCPARRKPGRAVRDDGPRCHGDCEEDRLDRVWHRFTSTEVVYGVTGTDVSGLPEYGVSP